MRLLSQIVLVTNKSPFPERALRFSLLTGVEDASNPGRPFNLSAVESPGPSRKSEKAGKLVYFDRAMANRSTQEMLYSLLKQGRPNHTT